MAWINVVAGVQLQYERDAINSAFNMANKVQQHAATLVGPTSKPL